MNRKCFDYEISQDTAGNPIMARQCYCLTTACMQLPVKVTSTTKPECPHYWYKCEPETDDIEHCSLCGAHRQPQTNLMGATP